MEDVISGEFLGNQIFIALLCLKWRNMTPIRMPRQLFSDFLSISVL